MPNSKFDVGETCRLNKALPLSVRTSTIKPGVYGKIVKAVYNTVSEHTMYTVQVGTKKIVVRGTALNPR